MLGNLLKSTIGVATDLTKIALAPVAITADMARAATKPIADAVEEAAEDVHDTVADDREKR